MMHSRLMQKGVTIYRPESVHIDESVNPERIESNVTIHAGTRIRGKDTLICSGSVIGAEAPATIDNCWVGPKVSLKGGFFTKSVFLHGASVGSGAHVREGAIFEEYASAAHQVGLKQTILFPFVTLGSLINFCDCLMAGGTGPKNHSEVGSSYIHFNFTPQQDKATPSMLGDVPGGVMLNREPIFLGGQGGLVGPARLAFGTVTAAGTICRSDELRENRLIFGGPAKSGNIAYHPDFFRNIKSIVLKNLYYIAGLTALIRWYGHVRTRFVSENMPLPLMEGLTITLVGAAGERISRLMAFVEKIGSAAENDQTSGTPAPDAFSSKRLQLYENRDLLKELILEDIEKQQGEDRLREKFLDAVDRKLELYGKEDYVKVIQHLDAKDAQTGTAWLQGIVDEAMDRWLKIIPAFEP
ncbi:MAG: protein GlmU [Desulfosalsimonadaceae bacterium]